jgi:predicted O-linked N-acetylglucosamine transferase (SPINDLY family)
MNQLEQDLKKIFNLIKINDFSRAKKELEINLNLHPNNYKIVFLLGIISINLKNFLEAKSFFQKTIFLNPDYAESYNNLGICYEKLNDNLNAKKNFILAIRKNKNFCEAYKNLGIIYVRENNLLRAVSFLKKSINPNNISVDTFLNLAHCYYKLKKFELAIYNYDCIIDINPNISQIYNNKGNALCELGKFDEAINNYNLAIKNNPNHEDYYINKANAYFDLSKYDLAIDSYNLALKIKPDVAKVYFLRGKIYKILGKTELAMNDFNKSFVIDTNYYNALIENLLILPHIYEDNYEFNRFRQRYIKSLDHLNNLDNFIFDNNFPDNQTFLLSYGNLCNLELLKKKVKVFRKIFPKLNRVTTIKEIFTSKIRIGFISEFLTDHTIGKLFQGLIGNLDKKKFDIFIFHSSYTKEGKIKKSIDSSATKSIKLSKNFDDKVSVIGNEKLDIIFYPDIGMSSDLYYLTFLRLAKYQINSWGHPETSGNSTIDYFISSKVCETPEAQKFYNEKLINFNNFTSFYEVPNFLQKDFNISNFGKYNIYFCSQSLFKILPDFDLILKGILEKDKRAQLVFINDQWDSWNKILLNRWKKSINKNLDRIKFVDRLSVDEFINLSGNSNVLLDPVYFGAGNSFIETFTYGTPMVTFPSSFLRSRLVMGLYNQMKINNPPVVYNNEDYINLSIELANNKKKNKEIRDQIIENSNKFFFNNYLVINEFENFFISLMSNNGQNYR